MGKPIAKMDIKSVIIVILLIAWMMTVFVFIGFGELKNYCNSCRQEGMNNALQSIINQIKNRGPLQWEIGGDKLVCNVVKD